MISKIKVLLPATLAILLMACGPTYKTATTNIRYTNHGVITHLPLMVDLNIEDGKSFGNFSCRADLGMDYAKNMAVANALKKANADVLVDPLFYTENSGNFLTVDVSGHAAHYKNFRTAKNLGDSTSTSRIANVVQPQNDIVKPANEKRKR